jgi:hypothetical protein
MVTGWPNKDKVRKTALARRKDGVQPTTKDQFGLKPASHEDGLTWLNVETD